MVEATIGLVAEHPGIVFAGYCDDFAHERLAHDRPRGVVGVVDADELHAVLREGAHFVEVGKETVLRFQVADAHPCAERFGNRIELLVGGQYADHVVAGIDQRVDGEVVGSDGTVGDGDVGKPDRLVQAAYARTQAIRAFDRPVGELHRTDIVPYVVASAGERDELVDREGFHAGLGKVVRAVVLVFVHPHLYAEITDMHGLLHFSAMRQYGSVQAKSIDAPASLASAASRAALAAARSWMARPVVSNRVMSFSDRLP